MLLKSSGAFLFIGGMSVEHSSIGIVRSSGITSMQYSRRIPSSILHFFNMACGGTILLCYNLTCFAQSDLIYFGVLPLYLQIKQYFVKSLRLRDFSILSRLFVTILRQNKIKVLFQKMGKMAIF